MRKYLSHQALETYLAPGDVIFGDDKIQIRFPKTAGFHMAKAEQYREHCEVYFWKVSGIMRPVVIEAEG